MLKNVRDKINLLLIDDSESIFLNRGVEFFLQRSDWCAAVNWIPVVFTPVHRLVSKAQEKKEKMHHCFFSSGPLDPVWSIPFSLSVMSQWENTWN